jgi:hypothetical protein
VKRDKRRAITRLARRAIPALRLEHWDITLSFGKLKCGSAAECDAQSEYKQAVLRFDCRQIPWDDIPRFVVHELMHCHVEALGAIAMIAAGKDKAKEEWVRRTEEELVTTLDQILAPYMK